MTFSRDGKTLSAYSGEGLLGSIDIIETPELVWLEELKLADGVQSGVGAIIGAEAMRISGDKPVYMHVDMCNPGAAKFYLKCGFTIERVVMRKVK